MEDQALIERLRWVKLIKCKEVMRGCISIIKLLQQTKSANVCLHLLPPISDHVIVHLRGNSCAIFYTSLSAREYLKMKLKYPLN